MISLSKSLSTLLLICLLTGCDKIYTILDIPDPIKAQEQKETDAKAIGAGCRHAGRSLEDCYALNPEASKTAVFQGWREMNDYMTENNLQSIPSQIVPSSHNAAIGATITTEAPTTVPSTSPPIKPNNHTTSSEPTAPTPSTQSQPARPT